MNKETRLILEGMQWIISNTRIDDGEQYAEGKELIARMEDQLNPKGDPDVDVQIKEAMSEGKDVKYTEGVKK